MSNLARSPVKLLIANLVQSISAYEKQKAGENTDINLPPRNAARARAIRQSVVQWLTQNGPATAKEVAEHFQFHKSTAHSYLNRIVHDDQARVINRRNERVFIVEEPCQ